MISPLQLTNATTWHGNTMRNHMALLGFEDRIRFNFMDSILEVNFGQEFSKFVNTFPERVIEDVEKEFEWFLCGPNVKNYPLVTWYENPVILSQGATPGANFQKFYVVFAERAFEVTDDIGTDSKENYQMHVTAVKPSGTNWEYEVELNGGNAATFFPIQDLTAGTRFAKLFSSTEQTLSRDGGTVSHESYIKLHNRASMISKMFNVPGNMISVSVAKGDYAKGTAFKDKDGKMHSTWIDKLSMDCRLEFNREKSNLQLYSILNKTSQGTTVNKGTSGYERKMGAGLFQQVSPSNLYYNTFWDLDYLDQVLWNMSYQKLPQDQRKFKLWTGEYGMKRLHKVLNNASIQFSANNAGQRIFGQGQELGFGGQFTKYISLNGVEVELGYMPFFDDPTFNTKQHPEGGLASSYEVLIMDIGTTKGQPNVQRIVSPEQEAWVYIAGLRDPFTANGSYGSPKSAASALDGYSVRGAFWGGIQVNNPTKIARILNNQI